jgi:hypothetical protein
MAVCIALIGKKMRASFDEQYELHKAANKAAKANA